MPHPDIIQISDVLARVAELEMCGAGEDIEDLIESTDAMELVELRELLNELQGMILHIPPWDDSYYPETLIRAGYFAKWCAKACDVPFLPDEVVRVIKRMYKSIPFKGTVYCFSSRGLP